MKRCKKHFKINPFSSFLFNNFYIIKIEEEESMNIVLLAPGFLISKKEATWITLTDLAKEYKNKGHFVAIVAEKHPGLPVLEIVNGIKVYRLFSGKFRKGYKTIKEIQQREKITVDIIHGFGSSPLMALNTFFAKKAAPKARIIHTIKSRSLEFWNGEKLSRLLNSMDRVTFPSKVMREFFVQKGLKKEKTRIIRSNINTTRFRPRNKEELKKKFGFLGKKVVLYYGAIRKEKGVDCLLQAAPEIVKEFPDVKFVLAIRSNAVEKKEIYMKMAEELECKNYVTITLDDLPIEEYVSMADCVVLAYPTLVGTEGNPSCLLESMAAKTPVITTSLPELQEIAQKDEEVLMAIPGDAHSVAEEVKRLFKDKQLGEKIAEKGYHKAQDFSVENVSAVFLQLYEELNE